MHEDVGDALVVSRICGNVDYVVETSCRTYINVEACLWLFEALITVAFCRELFSCLYVSSVIQGRFCSLSSAAVFTLERGPSSV